MSTKGQSTIDTKSDSDCCHDGASNPESGDSRFSCNICFDEVVEPVVTRCGHLYCWPCLFQWLEPGMSREERKSLGMSSFRYGGSNPSRRLCPVCKSECPLSEVVPVYVRSASRSPGPKPSTNNKSTEENGINKSEPGLSDEENNANLNNLESDINATNEGLRRRRTNVISDQSSSNSEPVPVPSRPLVTPPQHHQEEPSSPPPENNPYRVGVVQIAPRSPNGHNGSLTYGIVLSLHRAAAEYYRNTNANSADDTDRRRIPSLHDRRNPLSNNNTDGDGRYGGSSQNYSHYDESNGNLNSETTQYLSRLLIMLTSFVIFCFLLV